MNSPVRCGLTVLFEDPFWIGLYERDDGGWYEVCKITFGAQPSDQQVYEFMLSHWDSLRSSPPIRTETRQEKRVSPKRMQRAVSETLANKGIGTKAQQAMKLLHEQGKLARKARSREQKQAAQERRFALKQERKKARHRGR